MNRIKEIFKKLKSYFIQIFSHKRIGLIEANAHSDEQKILTLGEVDGKEQEKKDFCSLYKNVKNGTIKITDLMINDLIKVQLMMQNEANILDEKIEEIESEVFTLDTEIAILKKEREAYEKSVNN